MTLPQHPEANDVIGNAILEKNAHGVSATKYVPPVSPGAAEYLSAGIVPAAGRNRYPLTVMREEILVDSPLPGRHQFRNIALAIAAAEQLGAFGFKLMPKQIEQGIRQTQWPGRFQVVPPSQATGNHEVVLDVAHNPAGAWALRSALSANFPDRPLTFVFGAMRDKAIQEMAEILFPLAEHVVLTRVDNPRAATTDELRDAAFRTGAELSAEESAASALHRAAEVTKPGGVIVISGSIFLVGEVMRVMGLEV